MSLRTAVLEVADRLGVNGRLPRSRWRSRRLSILGYHGFALRDEHRWDPELFISREKFRDRLEYLRRNRFNVLPLPEALSRLKAGELPERSLCITVDDGLYDFIAVACPLLQEFACPATVYVSTYYVEHPWPVFDVMVSYLLWHAAGRGATKLGLDLLGNEVFPLQPASACRWAVARLRTRVREAQLGGEAKEALLNRLADRFGLDYAELRDSRILSLMRAEEIRKLDPALVDVQLHSHRHRMPENRELFLAEIAENRAALVRAGRREQDLVHFCYPNGYYCPAFLPWLREAAVISAVAGGPGVASQKDDWLALPRFIDTHRTTEAEFSAAASGLGSVLSRRTLGL